MRGALLFAIIWCALVAAPVVAATPPHSSGAPKLLVSADAVLAGEDCRGDPRSRQLGHTALSFVRSALSKAGFGIAFSAKEAHVAEAKVTVEVDDCSPLTGAYVITLWRGTEKVAEARGEPSKLWATDAPTSAAVKLFADKRISELDPITVKAAAPTPTKAPPVGDLMLRSPSKMVVLPLKAVGDFGAPGARLLTSMMLTQLDNVAELKTIGQDDIEAMLGVDKQRQALGCDKVACLAEIGGALGADLVAYGEVGRIGTVFSLNVNIVRSKSASVAARVSKTSQGSEEGLVAVVPELVSELVAKLNR